MGPLRHRVRQIMTDASRVQELPCLRFIFVNHHQALAHKGGRSVQNGRIHIEQKTLNACVFQNSLREAQRDWIHRSDNTYHALDVGVLSAKARLGARFRVSAIMQCGYLRGLNALPRAALGLTYSQNRKWWSTQT